MNPVSSLKQRDGFTLLEVLVAMVLLSIGLTSLAAMTFSTGRQGVNLTNASGREAVTMQELNRFTALPYSALSNHNGCLTMTAPGSNLSYNRCVTLTNTATYTTVQIVVTPNKTGTYADTVSFRRVVVTTTNPLFTP